MDLALYVHSKDLEVAENEGNGGQGRTEGNRNIEKRNEGKGNERKGSDRIGGNNGNEGNNGFGGKSVLQMFGGKASDYSDNSSPTSPSSPSKYFSPSASSSPFKSISPSTLLPTERHSLLTPKHNLTPTIYPTGKSQGPPESPGSLGSSNTKPTVSQRSVPRFTHPAPPRQERPSSSAEKTNMRYEKSIGEKSIGEKSIGDQNANKNGDNISGNTGSNMGNSAGKPEGSDGRKTKINETTASNSDDNNDGNGKNGDNKYIEETMGYREQRNEIEGIEFYEYQSTASARDLGSVSRNLLSQMSHHLEPSPEHSKYSLEYSTEFSADSCSELPVDNYSGQFEADIPHNSHTECDSDEKVRLSSQILVQHSTPLELWLIDLNLEEYTEHFLSKGFKIIQDFQGLSAEQCKEYFTLKLGDHLRLMKNIPRISDELIVDYTKQCK